MYDCIMLTLLSHPNPHCSTLQGRFKRPVPLDSLYFGTFLSQPLQLPASSLLTTAAVWLVNKLGGGAQLDVASPKPFVKAPLIAAAQQVSSRAGWLCRCQHEPCPCASCLQEEPVFATVHICTLDLSVVTMSYWRSNWVTQPPC